MPLVRRVSWSTTFNTKAMPDIFKPMDSYESFRAVEKQIDHAVKSGDLSRDDAGRTLKGAREAYKNQDYNREIEKYNKGYRKNK